MTENNELRKLDGLEACCFQHEMDRAWLDKLNHMPCLPKLVGWMVDRSVKTMEYELTAGGAFVVDEASFPRLWQIYRGACESLGLSKFPPLYVIPETGINAFAMGADNPIVCVTTIAVDKCTDGELRFILGHELGHVMCSHVKLLTLARYIAEGSGMMFSDIASAAFLPLLKKWARVAEVSADRAGLLACQDFEAVSSAFLRLSGLPQSSGRIESPSEVLARQVDLQREKCGELGLLQLGWRQLVHSLTADHPRIVERFECLRQWIEMGCFDELVQTTPAERHRMAQEAANENHRSELLVLLALMTAQYLKDKFGLERRDTLPGIRRAYLSGVPINGAAANRLLMSDLVVRKKPDDKVEYELQLYVRTPNGNALRAQQTVPYEDDWAFAPKAFREKFIRDRVNELKIGLYQIG